MEKEKRDFLVDRASRGFPVLLIVWGILLLATELMARAGW